MKYKTIVIDPPWAIKPLSKSMSSGKNIPYSTMTPEQIKEFPINDFADSECQLFMWCTQGTLRQAMDLLDSWEFRHTHTFVWNKQRKGSYGGGITFNGIHFNCEFLLYAFRGRMVFERYGRPMSSCTRATYPTRHSAKPDRIYEELVRKTPEPRIDIFARKRHIGFDAYGDQVEEVPLTLEEFD